MLQNQLGTGGDTEKMTRIYSIFNPNLVKSFELCRDGIMRKHEDTEGLFKRDDWRNTQDHSQRKTYLDHLSSIINQFRYQFNDGNKVRIHIFLSLQKQKQKQKQK